MADDIHVFIFGDPPCLLADLPTKEEDVDEIIKMCSTKQCMTIDEEGEFVSPGEAVFRVALPGYKTTVWTRDQLYKLVEQDKA